MNLCLKPQHPCQLLPVAVSTLMYPVCSPVFHFGSPRDFECATSAMLLNFHVNLFWRTAYKRKPLSSEIHVLRGFHKSWCQRLNPCLIIVWLPWQFMSLSVNSTVCRLLHPLKPKIWSICLTRNILEIDYNVFIYNLMWIKTTHVRLHFALQTIILGMLFWPEPACSEAVVWQLSMFC